MSILSILKPEGIVLNAGAAFKRDAFMQVSELASECIDMPKDDILHVLQDREKLGSTALGNGVAIPHGKIDGLSEITGFLMTLENPLDFDAVDEHPVDILFTLLAPTDATAAHLKALAKVSRFLRDGKIRRSIRGADSPEAIIAIAASEVQTNAA